MMEKFWFQNLKVILNFPLQLLNQWKAFLSQAQENTVSIKLMHRITTATGLHERSGEDDGPLNTAKLRSPTGLATRGSRIYICEHPDQIQGAIRVCFSLEGLIKYQSVWNEISTTMGLVSKRLSVAEPEHAEHVKGAKVSEALPELKQSAAKLEQLIESNKDRLNVQALDITHGSMASRTAETVHSTAVNSLNYVTEYFKHIEREDIVDKVLIRTFTSGMIKGCFGHITEMIGNNNPNFLEFARLVSREFFHYLMSTITSLGASGISIRRIRDEKPYTYFLQQL